jgi:hypothetical protein
VVAAVCWCSDGLLCHVCLHHALRKHGRLNLLHTYCASYRYDPSYRVGWGVDRIREVGRIQMLDGMSSEEPSNNAFNGRRAKRARP